LPKWLVDLIDTIYWRACDYADAVAARELANARAGSCADLLDRAFETLGTLESLPAGNAAYYRAMRNAAYPRKPYSGEIADLDSVLGVFEVLARDELDDVLERHAVIRQGIEGLDAVRLFLREAAQNAAARGRKPNREIDFFVLALVEALAVVSGVHDNASQTRFVDAVFHVCAHPGANAASVIERLRTDNWDRYMADLAAGRLAYRDLRSAQLERQVGLPEPSPESVIWLADEEI
jgi:hypothetical protein